VPSFAILTDADACIPDALRADLSILSAPLDPLPYDRKEAPIALRRAAKPAGAEEVTDALKHAGANFDAVLYVGLGDDYGGSPAIQEAALAGLDVHVRLYRSEGTLMGCGWQAVAAAVAARAGGSLEDAERAAAAVRDEVEVLAMLEHPPFAGVSGTSSGAVVGGRAIVRLRGARIDVLARIPQRDVALRELRDRFGAEARAAEGRLHVAIHHAGVEPAAEAMARWTERNLDAHEVVLAPLTRHAASRLGPGMVGFAWYRGREG
jgi:fatty acid-binding protein DegV